MIAIELIRAEWNSWNGFIFCILGINDTALLGTNFSSGFWYIDILFFTIKIFEK